MGSVPYERGDEKANQVRMIELSTRYDPLAIEPLLQELWCERKRFSPSLDEGAARFSMVIPPPNVTGLLHIGHALNATLQDILARYKRLRGYDVLWLPGVDHAGIATQFVVERDLISRGIDPRTLSKEGLIGEILAYKDRHGNQIFAQLKKLGASLDFSRSRFTMDDGFQDAVQTVFRRLFKEGLVYLGDYITNFCVRCQTALSDLEVNHQSEPGSLWLIRYPAKDRAAGDGVVVATTRPETMLGDVAVAVHPDDPRYRPYKEGTLVLPLVGRDIPLIEDAFVDPEFGSGAVKITPFHDFQDFEAAKRHGLTGIHVFDKDGKVILPGPYFGLDRFEARKRVVEDLKDQGLLVETAPYEVPAGRCYRCGSVIEPLVSRQWFVKMKSLAEPAIAAVKEGRLRFIPEGWVRTYEEWMTNIKDWCISRQIAWGHPIEALVCRGCGSAFLKEEGNPGDPCPNCTTGRLEEETDVLDTWFSSALWPFATLGWPRQTLELARFYPTDTIVTGFDILFFWVARMIMMGLKFTSDVPFRDVYIHALIRDEHGQKMSKSKGNVIDPVDMMEKYGTDALRFTLAILAVQGRDIRLSEGRIQGYRTFMNKIWNLARFAFMNAGTTERVKHCFTEPPAALNPADHWILSRLDGVAKKTSDLLDAYDFSGAANLLYHFTWDELCDWYVELSKIPLRGGEGDEKAESARHTLLFTLSCTLKLLHPFIPFITEHLYALGVGDLNGFEGAGFPDPSAISFDENKAEDFAKVIGLIGRVRTLRGEHGLGPAEPLEVFALSRNAPLLKLASELKPSIESLARCKLVGLDERLAPEGLWWRTSDGTLDVFARPLRQAADIAAEKARLLKEVQKIEGEIKVLKARLDNQGFREHAPALVISEHLERMELLAKKRDSALEHIGTIQDHDSGLRS